MRKLAFVIIAAALLVLVGGAVFLAAWKIPAPSSAVERAIPDDRFPR
jgi:hypothetical protein